MSRTWKIALFLPPAMAVLIGASSYFGFCAKLGRPLTKEELCIAAAKTAIGYNNVRSRLRKFEDIDEFTSQNRDFCSIDPMLPEGPDRPDFFHKLLGFRRALIVVTYTEHTLSGATEKVSYAFYSSNCGRVSAD